MAAGPDRLHTEMRSLATLMLLLPALLLAACSAQQTDSADDFDGPRKAVATALEDVEEAAGDDEWARLCSLLAPPLAKQIGRGNERACPQHVEDAVDDTDSVDLTVERVRISGDTATAEVEQTRSGDKQRVNVELVRGGGGWRLSKLAGAIEN